MGTVDDPSGAAVPDAQVTATSVQTGLRRHASTNSAGQYRILDLSQVTYDLDVTAPGFKPLRRTGVAVVIGHSDGARNWLAYRQQSRAPFVTVRLCDLEGSQFFGEPLRGHDGAVWSLAFSPEGKTLASGGADRTVRLWNLDEDAWVSRGCARANRNLSLAEWRHYFSPDVHTIALAPASPVGTAPDAVKYRPVDRAS